MGYVLFSINELILTDAQEALEVASSDFFARSIIFVCKWEEKQLHVVDAYLAKISL